MEGGKAAQDTVVGAFAEELGCKASERSVSAAAAEQVALAVVVEALQSVAEPGTGPQVSLRGVPRWAWVLQMLTLPWTPSLPLPFASRGRLSVR
jgi:hypothetical protein